MLLGSFFLLTNEDLTQGHVSYKTMKNRKQFWAPYTQSTLSRVTGVVKGNGRCDSLEILRSLEPAVPGRGSWGIFSGAVQRRNKLHAFALLQVFKFKSEKRKFLWSAEKGAGQEMRCLYLKRVVVFGTLQKRERFRHFGRGGGVPPQLWKSHKEKCLPPQTNNSNGGQQFFRFL